METIKKNTGLILFASIMAFLLFAAFKTAFKLADFEVLIWVVALLALAFAFAAGFLNMAGLKNAGMKLPGQGVFDGVWKFLVLLSGIIALNHGFKLFVVNEIAKALIFFPLGCVLTVFFFSLNYSPAQFTFVLPVYKPENSKFVLLKFLIALLLAALGIFFISADQDFFSFIAFSAAVVQLVLVFRVLEVQGKEVETSSAGERPGYAGVLSFLSAVSAMYLYYMSFRFLQAYNFHVSSMCFIAGSILFGYASGGSVFKRRDNQEVLPDKFDISFAVFIFLLSVFAASHQLWKIPPGIHGDEGVGIDMAVRLAAGEKVPVFLDSPSFQMAVLHYWLIALIGKFFGTNIITGRWLSIIVGSFVPVFTYLFAKNVFNRRVGIIASVLTSLFFMQLLYSRIAISWIFVPAFAAVSYYFFFLGLRKGSMVYYVASGAMLGLVVYFYSASKMVPLVIPAYLLIMLLNKDTRGAVTANWKGFVLLLLTALIVFSPVIDYIIHNQSKYFTRMASGLFIQKFPPSLLEWRILAENILGYIQMFFTRSSNGYCHNLPQKPFLDGMSSFFALAGLGYLLFTWKRESSAFLLVWLFFGMLPGFMTKLGPEDPFPSRVVLVFPALMIVIAIGIERIWDVMEGLWPKIFKWVMPLVAAYAVLWFSFYNLHAFFVEYKNDPHTQGYYRTTDKLLADTVLKNKDKMFLVSPFFAQNFYSGRVTGLDNHIIRDDVSLFNLHNLYLNKGQAVGIIGEGIYSKFFPIYKEYFPNAVIKTTWDPLFWQFDKTSNIKYCYGWKTPDKVIELNWMYHWFYTYDFKTPWVLMNTAMIPAGDINSAFALNADFFRDGKLIGKSKVMEMPITPPVITGLTEITGLLDVPDYGKYEFKIEGSSGSVYLNGSPASGFMELYKGLHRIKIIVNSNKPFSLKWRRGEKDPFVNIARNYLLDSDKVFGLTAVYRSVGKVIYKELEPMIDYRMYYYNYRPAGPYAKDPRYEIEWSGFIKMKKPGKYEFKMDTINGAKIMINGQVVYSRKDNKETVIPVELGDKNELVKIYADYFYVSTLWEGATLQFLYKEPGHPEFGTVTYDMLEPRL